MSTQSLPPDPPDPHGGFAERVKQEKSSLDANLEKLCVFFSTEKFSSLPETERLRLRMQEHYMRNYSRTLGERLAADFK